MVEEEIERDDRFEDDECLRYLSYEATEIKIPGNPKYSDIFGNSEYISFDSNESFITFSETWIIKIRKKSEKNNPFERFIYLWFIFNAWLSLAVSKDRPNRCAEDKFLIHAIAGSALYAERFESLYACNTKFRNSVDKFISWGPIFQATYLKNNRFPRWKKRQPRKDFVNDIYEKCKEEIKGKIKKSLEQLKNLWVY